MTKSACHGKQFFECQGCGATSSDLDHSVRREFRREAPMYRLNKSHNRYARSRKWSKSFANRPASSRARSIRPVDR